MLAVLYFGAQMRCGEHFIAVQVLKMPQPLQVRQKVIEVLATAV